MLNLDIITTKQALCPFCLFEIESIPHLSCGFSWQVWTSCLSWWGVISVLNHSPTQVIEEWNYIMNNKRKFKKQLWIPLSFDCLVYLVLTKSREISRENLLISCSEKRNKVKARTLDQVICPHFFLFRHSSRKRFNLCVGLEGKTLQEILSSLHPVGSNSHDKNGQNASFKSLSIVDASILLM